MAFEKITSEIVKIQADEVLMAKIKGAADLGSAVALAQGAGYDITKEDLLKFKASKNVELSDDALAGVAGGGKSIEGIAEDVASWY